VGHHRWRQVLVFTRTKHGADKLVSSLHRDGIGAVALHGNKSQNARTRALADFKAGAIEVLVATDIAARGIDIDQLPHVVNYDLPNVPGDYIHRIGRTGRAGADGEAISLVCIDEHVFLRDIERLLKRSIPRQVIPGFEPDPNAVAQPVFAQRGRVASQPREHTQQGQKRPKGWGQPGARGQGPSQPQQARHARATTHGNGNGTASSHARGHATADRDGADHAHRPSRNFAQRPASRRTDARNGATPASTQSRSKTKH
jgi:ATP-dependent RNA helicase RhlE